MNELLEQVEIQQGQLQSLPVGMQMVPMPEPSPLALLDKAIERGIPVEQLGKLFDLVERNEKRLARTAFFEALTAFKQNPPEILKTKKVSFGNTHYKHATLGDASVAIAQGLGNHGLSHRWETKQTEQGTIEVTCILSHELGHEERATLRSQPDGSGGKNAIQAIGSATAYLQRYTLFAVTGLSAQDDDDGAGADPFEKITKEQCEELAELIKAKNVSTDAFFGWASEAAGKMPIARLGEIPSALFQKCVDRLQKTKR